jgi:hypothetical protein
MKKNRWPSDLEGKGVSRRSFIKGGLTGAAALGLGALSTDLKAEEEKKASRKKSHTWMIDAFCHIIPPKYAAALGKASKGRPVYLIGRHGLSPQPTMIDVEARLRMMEHYEGYVQILNISLPPPEPLTGR